MPGRHGPVRPEDGGGLRRQAPRHRAGPRRGPRVRGEGPGPRLGPEPDGRRQRGRDAHGDFRVARRRRRAGHVQRTAPEAPRGVERVHGVGAGVDSRRAGEVRAVGSERRGAHHRTRRAAAAARERGRGPRGRQGHPRVHARDARPRVGPLERLPEEARAASRDAGQHGGARDVLRRAAEHRADRPARQARAGGRDPRLLLQVQRPALRQAGEAGDHDPHRERKERRPGAARI
mmetsp:Transcript_10774/g.33243  ORF Transcript_10774/g.33243 Transcript_10774/m.33243 type:complete len:233 (-) Transcript_10774:434-1132(-)